MKLKRLRFYCLLPFAVALVLAGFPMPLAPPRATKVEREQSAPVQ